MHPRKKVSSKVSGSGRVTTHWRTNSPGARGWRATTITSGTGRRGSNDSGTASRLPRPSRATPAAVSFSNPDLHAYIDRDHPLSSLQPSNPFALATLCNLAFLSHAEFSCVFYPLLFKSDWRFTLAWTIFASFVNQNNNSVYDLIILRALESNICGKHIQKSRTRAREHTHTNTQSTNLRKIILYIISCTFKTKKIISISIVCRL